MWKDLELLRVLQYLSHSSLEERINKVSKDNDSIAMALPFVQKIKM